MVESQPEELVTAKKLMREGKYEEALEIIKDFENQSGISDEDKLSALILEGKLYTYIDKVQEAVEVGELAYSLSQKLGSVSGTIEALLLKSNITFLGNPDEALDITQETENLIDSLEEEISSELPRERAANLFAKAWAYHNKLDFNKALELALRSLSFRERLGKKMGIANTLFLIGLIYLSKGELDPALDYATKSLVLQKEMNNPAGIASSLHYIGSIHFSKGEIDQALQLCNQALEIKESNFLIKFFARSMIGKIHELKGELDRALKHYKQALALSEAMDYTHPNIGLIWVNIGSIYRMKGDHDQAIEFLKRNLESTNEILLDFYSSTSLFWLISINLNKDLREVAQRYLSQLEELSNKEEGKIYSQTYRIAKALVLKASGRTRSRAEAEILLKKIVEGEIIDPEMYILSLISFCEFLLEELENSNDLEVINEINPVITRLLEIAEKQHSYSILAETKLLQGRLALIRLNLDDARQFLTTAQKIADEHGLTLLAQKISQEHDNLLEELETWRSFKKTKASISKRMKLAAVDGVMERMLGKRALEPIKLVDEQSILLMMITEGGVLIFSYPFSEEWKFDDELFGGFLTAFNSISDEIFSEGLDRVKFGNQTVLMEQVANFSICYLFKGQTYIAQQKLTKFIQELQNNTSLWQNLEQHYKTSQILELKKSPQLKSLITEIFASKN